METEIGEQVQLSKHNSVLDKDPQKSEDSGRGDERRCRCPIPDNYAVVDDSHEKHASAGYQQTQDHAVGEGTSISVTPQSGNVRKLPAEDRHLRNSKNCIQNLKWAAEVGKLKAERVQNGMRHENGRLGSNPGASSGGLMLPESPTPSASASPGVNGAGSWSVSGRGTRPGSSDLSRRCCETNSGLRCT